MKKRSLSSLVASAALALGLGGCAYNLAGTPEQNAELKRRQDSVLERYFTPQAAQLLNAIPIHFADIDEPWAHAAASYSMLDAMWNGWGYEPVIIYNISKSDAVKDELLVHEGMHFVDDAGMIDHDEFASAWEEMAQSQGAGYIARMINTQIAHKYGNISEDVFWAERRAWIAQYMVLGNVFDFWGNKIEIPERMREVYRSVSSQQLLDSDQR